MRPSSSFMSRKGAIYGTRGAGLGTGAVWLVATLTSLWFVSVYGLNMPYGDEWYWLGQATGNEPITWSWLWSQHNEHRMLVPRLIYLGLGRLSGCNFHAGAYFNIALLSTVSLATMLVARWRRGAASWYDAVFPLVMLQWGSFENLIWGFQLNFVVSVTFSTVAMLLIFCVGRRPSILTACLITACLLAVGMCGAYGLAYLPPLAAWLLLAAILPAGEGRGVALGYRLGIAGMAAMLAGFCWVYFWGFQRPAHHGTAPSLAAAGRTGWEFLAGSLGPAGKESWPFSGALVLIACGLAALLLLRALIRQGEERLRAAGLLAWLAGLLILAAGIGWGRSCFGPGAGFAERYMLLAAPLLCLCGLTWNSYVSPRWMAHLQRCLMVLVCVSFFVGIHKGPRYAAGITERLEHLQRDAQDGLSPAMLAVRYGDNFAIDAPRETCAQWLEMLHAAKLGPYRGRPLQAIQPTVVERLTELPRPKESMRTIAIGAGESFVQPLKAAHCGVLSRIDLELLAGRNKCAGKLDWTLCRVGPQQGSELLASGEIDLQGLGADETATLVCPPQDIEAGQVFMLTLRNPAVDKLQSVMIHGYEAASPAGPTAALKGFLFLRPDRLRLASIPP